MKVSLVPRIVSGACMALALLTLGSSSALAQATRTWVSGVGDDVNPGSRTAPCKTWAGAISKTAAGGEINAIDPGGFGALTITKAITIDGGGTFASALAGGTNGFVINAGVNDVVTLRNISINGGTPTSPGIDGVRFLAGAALHIENCVIFNFGSGKGINAIPSNNSRLYIKNTIIRNNSSGGILLKPGASANLQASLDNVWMVGNLFGIRVEDRATAVVSDSTVSGNTNNGFLVVSNSAPAVLDLMHCVTSHNDLPPAGAAGGAGISTSGASAVVRISNVAVFNNSTGLLHPTGNIISLGNNTIRGNTTDGAPTSTVPLQ